MDEVLGCFLDEAREQLADFADAVLRLEQDPTAAAPVDDMFRVMHTVKGAAGFLALTRTEELAHAAEDVLGRIRTGDLPLTPALASLLLSASDGLSGHLSDIAAHGAEQGRDTGALVLRLRTAASGDAGPSGTAEPVDLVEPVPVPASQTSGGDDDAGARTMRVSAATLDALLELVGELVTVRNSVSRLAATRDDLALTRCAGELEQVSAALRDAVRAARTRQVGTVWQALPRVARDTAVRVGRQVRVVMTGADLECDRDVLDAVREPLLHLVRNAVDHGIEDPAARVRAGKPAEGTIVLSARREGAHLRMDLSDDGAGIDPAAVADRALAMGAVTADELDAMAPDDVVRLVLRAGLSTSTRVTSVSGRGVGMDVVNLAVQQVGGRLDLSSVPGSGTTVTVHLPVSLGIARVLTVEASGARHALLVTQVVDLVRVGPDERDQALSRTAQGDVLRWRGRTVAVVDLRTLASYEQRDGDVADEHERDDERDDRVAHLAVVRCGPGLVALLADTFGDTEEVVVRPLDRALDGAVPCTGTAVLGDGTVVPVLDAEALARAHGCKPSVEVEDDGDVAPAGTATGTGADDVLLTVDAGGGRRLGLPLTDVARIVEVASDALRPFGTWEVVDLAGTPLPVVRAHPMPAPGTATGRTDGCTTPVVVVRTRDGREVGVAVAAVEDLAPATAGTGLADEGVPRVAVVAGRLVGQLDVRHAVADALEALDAQPDVGAAS